MTRLLLDEHLSGKVIGRALRESGHDARSISGEEGFEELEDDGVLGLAISEWRVLVTASVADFIPLIARLNDRGGSHTGCILIPNSFGNEEFGALIHTVERKLENVPENEWIDLVKWARKR